MPNPESARRKCGICSPDKKWPSSRRKRAVIDKAVAEGMGEGVGDDAFADEGEYEGE